MSATQQKKSRCGDCPHHRCVSDKDPEDWFNDDDQAVVCTLMPNPDRNKSSKHPADHSAHRIVAAACRPYEISKVRTPKWCPLKQRAVKKVAA